MIPNAFLARPENVRLYAGTRGIDEFPGFHTASFIDISAPYAQMRYEQSQGKDYPVIVQLNMRGLEKFADYDAFAFIKEPLIDTIKFNLSNVYNAEAIRNDLASLSESPVFSPHDQTLPQTTIDSLFLLHPMNGNLEGVLLDLTSDLTDEELINLFKSIRDEKVPESFLAALTGQFRYLEDVEEDRITAVYYMKPFWSKIVPNWDHPEFDEEVENFIEEAINAGFSIVFDTQEAEPEYSLVWGTPTRDGEFHGTSYLALKKAVPNLFKQLPKPKVPKLG
jgi:hypothetical protein